MIMTSFCLSSTESSFMTNQRNDKTKKWKKKKNQCVPNSKNENGIWTIKINVPNSKKYL